MSLLTLGLWSGFLLIPTFNLGPWVSSLTHLPCEPRFEDHSFLDQEIANFEQGMDSILTDSIEALKLDTSLDEPDVITSSVPSGFLHLVSTVFDTSKLQFVPSVMSHKLSARLGIPSPVSLATKMLASELICYFSIHPTAFGF